MLPQDKNGPAKPHPHAAKPQPKPQPKPRPLAGMTKDELRKLAAVHYRAAVAREAQGRDFILRAKTGAKTTSREQRAEWCKVENFTPKYTSVLAPNHTNPDTPKRWAQK